jgi:hypothetical protein
MQDRRCVGYNRPALANPAMTSIRRFPPSPFALCALLLPLLAGAASAADPVAQIPAPQPAPNCALAAPPPDAGIDMYMGMLLKIYPRNPDIGPAYSGCQTLWSQSDDGWERITVTHYATGHVVRVDSPATPHDPVEACLLEHGAVVRGDPDLCAQLDDMRFESLPADCADRTGPADPHCLCR